MPTDHFYDPAPIGAPALAATPPSEETSSNADARTDRLSVDARSEAFAGLDPIWGHSLASKWQLIEDPEATSPSVRGEEIRGLGQARAVSDHILLEAWEGVVLEVGTDDFLARLSRNAQEAPDEEARLLVADLAEGDLELLTRGAVFYWTISRVSSRGVKSLQSTIRFRRLPAWSTQELAEAEREALELSRELSQ